MEYNRNLDRLPHYLFGEVDKAKDELLSQGRRVMDLGIGDPDMPPSRRMVEELKSEIEKSEWHRYPPYAGTADFKQAAAEFYLDRFGVSLDPDSEVLGLIGSKEGIAHLPYAVLNPGDYSLVPDPAYPVYGNNTLLTGCMNYYMPLAEENSYLPDLDAIPSEILGKSKLMFLNYPNNPTGAVAPLSFLEKAVEFGRRNGIIIAYDNAYSEIYYDEADRPPSILEVKGAKDVAVEFNSLSKMFNVTGWRIGFAAGSVEILRNLLKLKKNIDSGVFSAIAATGAYGLRECRGDIEAMRKLYLKRRDLMTAALEEAGLEIKPPSATFYLWCKIPGGGDSTAFCKQLLEETGVLITPGVGFGKYGEGYFRISLTCPDEDLEAAAVEIVKFFNNRNTG
ncbi:MAG: LL-diaminopimelate aminotransferase [Chloroflexi bacterium]|nr:LL-diaminopimelate aminotransferase [Chloroflexota bacterium]